LGGFFSELRSVLRLPALRRVGRKMSEDDTPGYAGQLAYFMLFFMFPFLLFLAALTGLVIDEPGSALRTLTESMRIFLPLEVVGLVEVYIDRTLSEAGFFVLFLGILVTLWTGAAASRALVKAANRAYGVEESRSLPRRLGISLLMILGLTLFVGALALVVLSPRTGGVLQSLTGLPNIFISLWNLVRWAIAFLALSLALDVFYYMAPNAKVPFRWVTPGGFAATLLILLAGAALSLYVVNLGRYDQLYGQVGTLIVMMLWLYVTAFVLLLGIEVNAVLARMAEEKRTNS
jgi:membrane protein